jgi:hypothetical protein
MNDPSELLGKVFDNGSCRARIVEVPANSVHGYLMVESLDRGLRWPVTIALARQMIGDRIQDKTHRLGQAEETPSSNPSLREKRR